MAARLSAGCVALLLIGCSAAVVVASDVTPLDDVAAPLPSDADLADDNMPMSGDFPPKPIRLANNPNDELGGSAADDEPLDEADAQAAFVELDEGKKQSLWVKRGVDGKLISKLPPNTNFYKTLKGFEHHGKCRFSCFQDSVCGGYSWVPASHTCKLFSAPNHLLSPFSNDRWHKAAAPVTGQKYTPDQATRKANKKLKKGLKKFKKKKSKRPKTLDGNVKLGLEKIANKALKRSGATIKGPDATKLKVYKAKLYSEFVGRYTHEYQARAEKRIDARAQKIADQQVKKINKKHKKKVTKDQALVMFKQAKKQVAGHAIRQIRRNFKKHIKSWTNAKMRAESERLVAKRGAKKKARHKKVQAKKAKAKTKKADAKKAKLKKKAKKSFAKKKKKAKDLSKAKRAKSKAKSAAKKAKKLTTKAASKAKKKAKKANKLAKGIPTAKKKATKPKKAPTPKKKRL